MAKIISKISAKVNLKKMAGTFMCAAMMIPMTTFCTLNTPTAQGVMTGVLNIIFEIAKYVGVVLAVSGIFSLILAYKDDNADGQSRAVRLVVVALVLLGLKPLVAMTGLI